MKQPLLFSPYSLSHADTVYRDTLPHRSCTGKTIFVTWRLSDSLPSEAELHTTIRNAQSRWLKKNGLHYCPRYQKVERILTEHHPHFVSDYARIPFWVKEQFDQRKTGTCPFRNRAAVQAVRRAIEEEETWSLEVGDGVICYNHVHLLFIPRDGAELKRHMQRIKGRSSCYLRHLGLSDLPKPFWQRYGFDHIVRSRDKLERIRSYLSEHHTPVSEAKWSVEWEEE